MRRLRRERMGAGGRLAGARSIARDLATRGVAWIVTEGTTTTQGTRFRVRESDDGPAFPAGVYDGAAGVAMVLADWTRATRDHTARDLLRSVAEGLVASATPHGFDPSLYLGDAGRISALLRAAAVLRDPVLRDAAVDLASGLLRATWELPDLLYGPAGTGIAALQLYRATGDRHWLRGARRAVNALDAMAVRVADGVAWRMPPGGVVSRPGHADPDHEAGSIDTGIAHGAGGVLLFLEQAAPLIGDRRLTRLRAGSWRWLAATAQSTGRSVAWPKAMGDERPRHHWCHGTAGLVQLMVLRAHSGRRADGPERVAARSLADRAGRHAWEAVETAVRRGRGESACHCHGLSGTLDALCALDRIGVAWVRRPIARLVEHLACLAGPGDGPASFGAIDAGMEQGAAGTARVLMLAAGMRSPAPWEAIAVSDLRGLRVKQAGRATGLRRAAGAAARRSKEAKVRLAPAAALPPVAAPLRDGRLVIRTPATHPQLAGAAQRLLADERLRPLHESWGRLTEGLDALAAEHRAWVRPPALRPEHHLTLMHRIAGILLHGAPSAAVRTHRRGVAHFLVRRHLAAVGRCLELAGRDRAGVLAGVVAGPLDKLEPLDAEPHRGGQRSIALRFAEGPELIFKPRDLRLDAFLVGDEATAPRGAATLLNPRLERALGTRIPIHGIFCAGPTHGYAERLADARRPITGGRALRLEGVLGGALPRLRGHALGSRREATAFWRAAGALASHLAAFGVGDQHSENVVLGRSHAEPAPRLHAVDCEVAFQDGVGVGSTQLVPSRTRPNPEPGDGAHTHFGYDARRWDVCGVGAPLWVLAVDRRGRLVPVDPPQSVQRRPGAPVVVATDGSSGYAAHLGAVLRGAAEHWIALRANLSVLRERMRAELPGARARVLRKSTSEYLLAVAQRELGVALWPGALAPPRIPEALPFDHAELAQLAALDVPAFDCALGRQRVDWVAHPPDGRLPLEGPFPAHLVRRWWRLPERAAGSDALARAIGELTAFVVPPGPYSLEDPANGVHVLRATAEEPVQVALSMPRRTAQFRLEPDGSVTHWGLPAR